MLKVTPHADLTEFAITGEGVLEPLLRQVRSVPKAVVTPAGFATVGAHRHVLGTFRVA